MKQVIRLLAAGTVIAAVGVAAADDGVRMTVDRTDLRRVSEGEVAPRFSSLLGQEVYGSKGKRIGEIEDFVIAKGGEVYAVIDRSEGLLADIASIGDDDIVVVKVRELRRAKWIDGVYAPMSK